MVLDLNGHVKITDAQTGKGQRCTIFIDPNGSNTNLDFDVTGVTLTRAELVSEGYLSSATLSGTNTFTVNGVTYSADATYDAAYAAQNNVDALYKKFAALANPVFIYISDAHATTAAPWDGKEIELVFEQKGFLQTPVNRGDVTVGAAVDYYGDAEADFETVLDELGTDGLLMDSDTTAATFANGTDYDVKVKVSPNLQNQ